ncbi:uncharacterized protein PV06_09633 [Exophiala oligosperma]|uniref:Cytochrome P450 n=1 Tax=Exophiala oligosperma TaxID=215243 RepID=A0A0D2D662_9EURO|nr:uncharacterized protein PV06_09633 [Exophiala oligosperma]KIW38683.1 hypothetical protein PV06_09633 [Exophiala oligosperma]
MQATIRDLAHRTIMFGDSGTLAITIWPLLLLLLLWLVKTVYAAYFTPLASVPGPWLAKFTALPLKVHVIKARRVQYIDNLHKIYGPVVRIAPNEVDVTDLDGYRAIHKIGNGFTKSQWYPRFRTAYRDQDVFSETNIQSHSVRRRILSRPFSKSNLRQNWEALVREKAHLALRKMRSKAETGVCDIFEWWSFFTTDVIGQVAFGESFGMLETGKKAGFIQLFEDFSFIATLRAELPFVYYILRLAPNFIYDVNGDEKEIIRQGKKVLQRAGEGSIDKKNIFTGHLSGKETSENYISAESIVVEATGLIGAGGGTTSVTLTYLVWAVLSNPCIQQRLEDEVSTLPTDFTDNDLESLQYLNAVIQETLRMYGPIPGSLRRVVPNAGLQIGQYFLPPGTEVCTQSYSLHRKPEIFESPELFKPDRFLQQRYAEQEQATPFAAFGAGSRVCLGIHLAYIELRVATALFFRECRGARLALSHLDDMDMINFFGGFPKGRSCNITLRMR